MWLPNSKQVVVRHNPNYIKSFWLAFYGSLVVLWKNLTVTTFMPFFAGVCAIAVLVWHTLSNAVTGVMTSFVLSARIFFFGLFGQLDGHDMPAYATLTEKEKQEVMDYVRAQRALIDAEMERMNKPDESEETPHHPV